MNSLEYILILVGLFIIINAWNVINPKLDWNYELEERLLWYNDPFDHFIRKSIVIWRKKT